MENNRYSSIDQLRFIAALCVALSHIVIFKKGFDINLEIISSIAVEVFFIISGFVLTPQIINLINKSSFQNYKIFLLRRWYRTIPLYLLSLILISILLGRFISFDFFKYLFFIQNFLYIWVSNDYYSIAWSLSVEEWFYIIFPLYLILLFRFSYKINIFSACIIFIITIFILRLLFSVDIDWGQNIRRVVIFRLDAIVFGVLLFLIKDRIKKSLLLEISLLILIFIFSFIVFEIMKVNAVAVSKNYQLIFHYIIAIWGSLVVLFFYIFDKRIKNKILINLNLYLGKISYSIYLFHLSVIYFISLFEFSILSSIILFLIIQIILSSLLYHYIEKPILKGRPKYKL